MVELHFELITDANQYPYDLLLLADETVEAIDRYVHGSEVYRVISNGEIIGVFCLFELDAQQVELKNIAVNQSLQGAGIGSQIINFVKKISRVKYKTLIVGTPDIATRQLNFYEKNGFVRFGVRRNFFIDNYSEPIIENDVQLRDMVLLKFALDGKS